MKNKTSSKIAFRQGDVYLERIAKLPTGLKKQKPQGGRIILAYGEATFHHHSIDADAADWLKQGDEQYVEVKEPTRVVHQEHAPIELTKGTYRISRQCEYSPAAIRNVQD